MHFGPDVRENQGKIDSISVQIFWKIKKYFLYFLWQPWASFREQTFAESVLFLFCPQLQVDFEFWPSLCLE